MIKGHFFRPFQLFDIFSQAPADHVEPVVTKEHLISKHERRNAKNAEFIGSLGFGNEFGMSFEG
jgi:hypothetical protein